MHAPNNLITFHPYANLFFHHAESQFLLASGICKRIFDWLIAKTSLYIEKGLMCDEHYTVYS